MMRSRHDGQNLSSVSHTALQAASQCLPTDLRSNYPHPLWMACGVGGCRGLVKRCCGTCVSAQCEEPGCARRDAQARAQVKRQWRAHARDWRKNHLVIHAPSWPRVRRLSTAFPSDGPHALWRTASLREAGPQVNCVRRPPQRACLSPDTRTLSRMPGQQIRFPKPTAQPCGCAVARGPAIDNIHHGARPAVARASSPARASRAPRWIHFTFSSRKARITPPISTPWVSSAR